MEKMTIRKECARENFPHAEGPTDSQSLASSMKDLSPQRLGEGPGALRVWQAVLTPNSPTESKSASQLVIFRPAPTFDPSNQGRGHVIV